MYRRLALPLSFVTLLLGGCSPSPTPNSVARPMASTVVSPERGSLVVVGGGRVGPEIVNEFIRLAGGKQAAFVVIPTAGGDTAYADSCTCVRFLRDAGATDVTVLHTYDPKQADTEEFVAPIGRASAVWLPGGRQWRLADAYLGTRTERELHALLARGGVVGGSAAGASIQASYLVRGAPEGNSIMMSPGHEKGFGFLRDVAVDQHVLARNRLNDLPEVLARHRQLLGIGIDEGTAIVVQRDTFSVIGVSKVFVYGGRDAPDSGKAYRTLGSGDRYSLRERRIIR